MKKKIVLILLILTSTFCFAQEFKAKQSLRLGLNGAFWRAGELTGKAIYGEYFVPMNKFLAVSSKINSGFSQGEYLNGGNRNSKADFFVANAIAISISVNIIPLPKKFQRFSVDVGALHHNIALVSGYNNKPEVDSYFKNSLGFYSSFNIFFINNEKVESGFKTEIYSGFYGNNLEFLSLQAGIYFGVKF